MIKVQRKISLFILAIAFISIGCNPGIVDVPAPQVTDASAYFFAKNSQPVNFQDSSITTGGKFVPLTLSFSALDSNNTFFIKENTGSVYTDSLSATLGSGAISISGISAHTFIPLPAGFFIKSKYNIIQEQIPAPISHVVVTPYGGVIATCDELGIFYSPDAGKSWTPLSLPFGAKSNRITALTSHGSKVFAGTLSGSVYMSNDNGATWGYNPIQTFKDSILAFAVATSDLPSLYISVKDTVYKTSSPGSIPAKPIGASNLGKLFTSLALYVGSGSDSVLIGGTLGSGLWSRVDGNWNQISSITKNAYITSVAATPLGIYSATTSSVFASQNGIQWNLVANLFPYGVLSYDAQRYAVIAANRLDSVIEISDSLTRITHLASLPVRSLHDLSAANLSVYAATDSGLYELSSNTTSHWNRIFSVNVTRSATKEFPGDIVLLRSRTGNVTLDSSWQVDTLISTTASYPITARIVGHLDQVTMSDSTKYSDVIEVRYGYEIAGQLVPTIPYWDILYSKKIGPIIIFQISGSAKTRKIYRTR